MSSNFADLRHSKAANIYFKSKTVAHRRKISVIFCRKAINVQLKSHHNIEASKAPLIYSKFKKLKFVLFCCESDSNHPFYVNYNM